MVRASINLSARATISSIYYYEQYRRNYISQAITTELESKEELITEMMKESEQLLALADKDHLYVIPADLGDKVTSFKADWKVAFTKVLSITLYYP